MFLIANFLSAVALVLDVFLMAYTWLIIGRVIISWVSADPRNPIVRFLYSATEPLLYWVRRRLPTVYGSLDLSPLVLFAGIYFLRLFLVRSMLDVAARIQGM